MHLFPITSETGKYPYRMSVKLLRRIMFTDDPDACWELVGTRNTADYGIVGKRRRRAHRLVWEMFTGHPVPKNGILRHSCDNPPCCNPKHLTVGTHKENVADMWQRKRGFTPFKDRVGAKHHNFKLTDGQIAEIRFLASSGEKGSVLARRFGVSQTHIIRLVRGFRPGKT